jgi:hypothetical protein
MERKEKRGKARESWPFLCRRDYLALVLIGPRCQAAEMFFRFCDKYCGSTPKREIGLRAEDIHVRNLFHVTEGRFAWYLVNKHR